MWVFDRSDLEPPQIGKLTERLLLEEKTPHLCPPAELVLRVVVQPKAAKVDENRAF